jgi:hypothetical protein
MGRRVLRADHASRLSFRTCLYLLPAHTGRSREVERGQKYKALILSSRLPRDGSRLDALEREP